MDWKLIQDRYPKAWNQYCLQEWNYTPKEFSEMMLVDHLYVRGLYDFFDQNELWIEISAQTINSWSYDVFKLTEDNFICIFSENNYKLLNRKEAEEAAFTKAFEILESKLK
jgi:hypothetical protein